MKCTASNRTFRKQQRFDAGMKEAVRKCSLFLDYVLSDKLRWSNSRIGQIHSTFNDVADKVQSGEMTLEGILQILKEEHNANVIIKQSERIRPKGLYSDYINGVYASSDKVSIILLYVLIHVYRLGGEKANRIMSGISDIAESVNLGYVTEKDIKQGLMDEEGLEVKKLKDVG